MELGEDIAVAVDVGCTWQRACGGGEGGRGEGGGEEREGGGGVCIESTVGWKCDGYKAGDLDRAAHSKTHTVMARPTSSSHVPSLETAGDLVDDVPQQGNVLASGGAHDHTGHHGGEPCRGWGQGHTTGREAPK